MAIAHHVAVVRPARIATVAGHFAWACVVAASTAGCLPDPDVTIKLVDRTEDALGLYVQTGRLDIDKIGSGAAIGDVDGDGKLDLIFARAPDSPGGPPMLWLNDGSGLRFHEATGFEAFGGGRKLTGVSLGDYDGDGDLDVYLSAMGKDVLLQNQGNGTFVDVTDKAGVGGPDDDLTTGGIWADVNDDGLLDLFVTNYIDVDVELAQSGPISNRSVNRLYLNLGNGTFLDATQAAGVSAPGATHTAALADIDGDGVPEIYVANDRFDVGGVATGDPRLPPDQVWKRTGVKNGIPQYTDISESSGIAAPRSSMGIAFPDVDGDGRPEVYISNYGGNNLYYYHPNTGTFTEGAHAVGLDVPTSPTGSAVSWGVVSLDLDRDGVQEMLVVNGQVSGSSPQQLLYLEQNGPDGYFESVVQNAGLNQVTNLDYIQWARGAYIGDLDEDGDDDVVMGANGGVFTIYENQSTRRGQSVRLRLVGAVSAPVPVGAKVVLDLDDGSKVVRRQTAGGQPYGQSDPVLDLVTVDHTVRSTEIDWPSGFVQRLKDVSPGAVRVIREPRWLEISTRNVAAGSSATITYTACDDSGAALGGAGAGRSVGISRSDGVPVAVTDVGDGTYTASIGHPGSTRTVTLAIRVDGVAYAASPMIRFE